MGGVLPYGQEKEPRPIPAFGRAGAPRPVDPGDNYPDAGGSPLPGSRPEPRGGRARYPPASPGLAPPAAFLVPSGNDVLADGPCEEFSHIAVHCYALEGRAPRYRGI